MGKTVAYSCSPVPCELIAAAGAIIGDMIQGELGVPVVELEISPLSDAMRPALKTRLAALLETAKELKKQ